MLIDVHAHIGRLGRSHDHRLDANDLIAKMDAWGIQWACVLALSEHPEGCYLDATTDIVITACSRYPRRLIPFCLLDPRFDRNSPDMDFSYWIEDYVACGCKGMGEMLPKLPFDDPRCLNLFRQAGRFGLCIIFDMNDNPISYGLRDDHGLPRLEKALRECPDTVFVGHGPTFWAEISKDVPEKMRFSYPPGPIVPGGAVPRLMRQYPNLWADLSASSGHNAMTRDPKFGIEFMDEFQDKLMFGTDACSRLTVEPVCPNVELIKRLRQEKLLSPAALDKIESGNAIRLMKLAV